MRQPGTEVLGICGSLGLQIAALHESADDPEQTSTLRQASGPHAFADAFPAGEISRTITCRVQAVFSDCKLWIKSKCRPRCGLRFLQFAGQRQCGSQMEMCDRVASV